MAAFYVETKVIDKHIDVLAQKIRDIATFRPKMTFTGEKAIEGGCEMTAKTGFSMTSYGERMTITMKYLNAQQTEVKVFSKSAMPTVILDFGQNSENVGFIFFWLNK
ncbi:MAG: hypothetical protein IJP03_04995 [Christensenellaceae bacterium]|nr:hypothetical protein [Christensenellaceae bacterium]